MDVQHELRKAADRLDEVESIYERLSAKGEPDKSDAEGWREDFKLLWDALGEVFMP